MMGWLANVLFSKRLVRDLSNAVSSLRMDVRSADAEIAFLRKENQELVAKFWAVIQYAPGQAVTVPVEALSRPTPPARARIIRNEASLTITYMIEPPRNQYATDAAAMVKAGPFRLPKIVPLL